MRKIKSIYKVSEFYVGRTGVQLLCSECCTFTTIVVKFAGKLTDSREKKVEDE